MGPEGVRRAAMRLSDADLSAARHEIAGIISEMHGHKAHDPARRNMRTMELKLSHIKAELARRGPRRNDIMLERLRRTRAEAQLHAERARLRVERGDLTEALLATLDAIDALTRKVDG